MANKVDIDIYAHDKTKGVLKDIDGEIGGIAGSFEQLTGLSLSTAGIIAGVGGAISGIVDFTKDAIDETSTYNDQIKDLARITGDSLGNTSRLIQVAGDMGVEYKDLVGGLGNATKNGVDVSIDSLLALADEYKTLDGPIERAEWLTDNFGAAGRDLEPIFEASSQSIVEDLATVDDALVWDEEKQATIDAYEQGMADVQKSFEDVKIEVTMGVLPALQAVLDVMNNKEGSRGEGYRRMLGDVTTDSWALVDALKSAWAWLLRIANGPNGGHVISGAAIGIGSTAPTLTGQATGGIVGGSTPYIVGEKGPELFVPQTAGRIVPNSELGGGGGFDYVRMARLIREELSLLESR